MPANNLAPVYVLGVGMTKFMKPRGKVDYTEMGYEAGIKAMLDAHINYDDVDRGIACYVYGDSACGQRVFYQFGMTGIPIYNVNNNCGSGATGLEIGRNAIAYGQSDCVLVVGFEKMMPGSLKSFWDDRANPLGRSAELIKKTKGPVDGSFALRIFAYAGEEYIEKYVHDFRNTQDILIEMLTDVMY